MENYDKFEKASTENKIIILKKSSIPLGVLTGKQLINITLFFRQTNLGAIFRNGFIIFSFVETCRNNGEIICSDALTNIEKFLEVGKRGLAFAAELLSSLGGAFAGIHIGLLFSIVSGPGAVIVGTVTEVLFGYITGK